MPFELHDSLIRAVGATRPGLVVASVQGLNAALAAVPKMDAEDVEHPFSFAANSFPELLQRLLAEAMKLMCSTHESYLDLKMNLVTETHIDGSFVGKPATIGKTYSTVSVKGNVSKDEDGMWSASVELS